MLYGEEHNISTYNDINSSLGRFRGNRSRLEMAIETLVKRGCIRAIPVPPSGKPGRLGPISEFQPFSIMWT